MRKIFNTLLVTCSFLFLLSFSNCNPKGQTGEIDFENTSQKEENKVPHIAAPKFNADSAFYFVKKQVDFGPRVPNSGEHRACGDYLIETLESLGASVIVQEIEVRAYNGKLLKGRNFSEERMYTHLSQISSYRRQRFLLQNPGIYRTTLTARNLCTV